MKQQQDGQFLCQKHGRLSFDICLHPLPMEGRLLCRLCKQDLPQEKLMEVTSLSDFFSGNFLNAPRDMLEQKLKKSQQNMNQDSGEKKIRTFFSDLEQGLIETLNEAKGGFFDKYLKNYRKTDEGNQIKNTIEELLSEVEIFKADPHKKFYETAFLNRFSQRYSSLLDASTKYVEEEPPSQTNCAKNLDKFELNSDSYKLLKELCLGQISSLLKHYDEDKDSETSSDGYVDPSDVTVKIIQDDDGDEEQREKTSVGGKSETRGEKVQKQPLSKSEESQGNKSLNESETDHSEEVEQKSRSSLTKEGLRRLKRRKDFDEDAKENWNGDTASAVNPVLKKVKKTTPPSFRYGKSPATIEIENESDDKNYTQVKPSNYDPREISVQPIHTFEGKYDYILWGGLCYIPDKKHIVAGDQLGNLCVWSAETCELLFHKYIAAKIYKIIYLSRKNVLLLSREDGEIGIFDVKKDYSFAVSYKKHPKQVFSMAYISSLDLIGSSGEEGNIALWSYSQKNGSIRSDRMLMTDNMQVSALCYIEEKDLLAAATYRGGYVMIFNPSVNQYLKRVKGHNKIKSIDCLCYVPEWEQVVSGSEDTNIKFWDLSGFAEESTLACVKTLRRNASYIESIVVIPEANCLINTNVDPKLSVWNLVTDSIMYEMMGSTQEKPGEAMIYLEDQKELVTAFGNEIRLWKIKF